VPKGWNLSYTLQEGLLSCATTIVSMANRFCLALLVNHLISLTVIVSELARGRTHESFRVLLSSLCTHGKFDCRYVCHEGKSYRLWLQVYQRGVASSSHKSRSVCIRGKFRCQWQATPATAVSGRARRDDACKLEPNMWAPLRSRAQIAWCALVTGAYI
jgi:hypothetical protein